MGAPPTSGLTVQVQVPGSELSSARDFYARLFDRDPDFAPHDDFLEWFVIKGQECIVQIVGTATPTPLRNRVRFRVEDIAAATQFLDGAGVAYRGPTRLPGVVAFLDFDDPWGNALGYYEDLVAFEDQRVYPGSSVHDESIYEAHTPDGGIS